MNLSFVNNRFYFILFIFLSTIIFTLTINFNGLYGADGYEYLLYSKSIKQLLISGISIQQHDFIWPPIYPFLGALLSFVFSPILSMQIVSILSFGGVLLYTNRIIVLQGAKQNTLLFLFLFGFLSPYFFRLSICIMSDMLAIFFCIASIFHSLNYMANSKNKDFIFALFLALFSVFTRYSSFIVTLVPVTLTIKHFFKQFRLLSSISLIIFITILLLIIIILTDNFYNALNHPLLQHWSYKNYFLLEFNYEDGLQSYSFINLVFILFIFFHPGFNFLGTLLAFTSIKVKYPKSYLYFILLPLLLYVLFLGGTPNQNIRLLSFIYPLILVLFYWPFNQLYEKYIQTIFTRVSIILVIVVIQISLIFMSLKSVRQYNVSEKRMVEKMACINNETKIYTTGIAVLLDAYGVKNEIVELWKTKTDTIILPAVLLIKKEEKKKKEVEKLYYQNWIKIVSKYNIIPLYYESNDWLIYEIKRK